MLRVWCTDVELARRIPALVRPLIRGARQVIAASTYLAEEARSLGARDVVVVPFGVDLPPYVGEPDKLPHVLYAGRLSEEKGVLDFMDATAGLPRVIVGDGPLRARVAEAVGFAPPAELGAYYERAAVVCVPSRREGYGLAAREAMAYGRPLVATRVGGLTDLAGLGVVLVPPANVPELRKAIEELLNDSTKRARLGAIARATAAGRFSHAACATSLIEVYEAALGAT